MKKNKKTVFFGPFVGEFGWELLYWHGWVKRLCRGRYANYRKIACSFPGRRPFYPDVDEFWSLPKKFLTNRMSPRGYIMDCWIKSFPKPDKKPSDLPKVMPLVNEVIKDLKKKLPKNTEFIIPWELRYDEEDKRFYGVTIPKDPKSDREFITHKVPFSNQILEKLQPTPDGVKLLRKIVGPKERLITIFPRHRVFRRPDKNWIEEKYEILIHALQREFPNFKVAILGEPGGTFFEKSVPKGCVDLIQIDPNYRMDIQLATLQQSVIAIGSQSGGTTFALAAGCKTLTWGGALGEKVFCEQNYLGTELVFYPSANPSVDTIFKYTKWMLGYGETPWYEIRRLMLIHLYRLTPWCLKRSKLLYSIKKLFKVNF